MSHFLINCWSAFLLVMLASYQAMAFEVSCLEVNRANPDAKPRQYTIKISELSPAPQGENSEFKFGVGMVLRQELNSSDLSIEKTTTLIDSIPCVLSSSSPTLTCALEENLPRGKFTTAKFNLKSHHWEFLRWKEGGAERDTPLLVKIEETHFFIENQRFKNKYGERQPLVLSKRFKTENCRFVAE